MSKEIGAKEQRLREFKEAKYERQQAELLKMKRQQVKPKLTVVKKRGRSR